MNKNNYHFNHIMITVYYCIPCINTFFCKKLFHSTIKELMKKSMKELIIKFLCVLNVKRIIGDIKIINVRSVVRFMNVIVLFALHIEYLVLNVSAFYLVLSKNLTH